MSRLFRAELIRLFATPSRVVIAALGLLGALGSALALSMLARDPGIGLGIVSYGAGAMTWFVSTTVAVLAIMMFGGDWSNRSIVHSFTHANRSAVLATKVLLLVGLVLVGGLVLLAQIAIVIAPPVPDAASQGMTISLADALGKLWPVAFVKTLLMALLGAALATLLTSMWGGILALLLLTFVLDIAAKIGDVVWAASQGAQSLTPTVSQFAPNTAFDAVAAQQATPVVILVAFAWIVVPWALGIWRWTRREV